MKSDHLKETSLRYFLEVSRCGTITQAADQLHVAASAVSRQIKGLENVLGVKLFERRPRGVVLSAAGELLAEHARHASLDADRVVADILALDGLNRGRIRLACTEGFGIDLLPDLVATFHQRHAGIQFELEVVTPARVSELICNGDVDIGLGFSRAAQKEIHVHVRRSSPLQLIVRPDHELATRTKVTLRQLAGYPLVLPGPATSLRQIIDIACSRHGIVFDPVMTSNSAPALHRFVLHSGVASIASSISVRSYVEAGSLVAVPLQDRYIGDRGVELQTLRGRTLPKVVQLFLAFLRQRLESANF
jgi:DNA-binding transcriptional LysR family regulator